MKYPPPIKRKSKQHIWRTSSSLPMTTTGALQKRQYKLGKTTLLVSSLVPHPLYPCNSGANQFHKPNANSCWYNYPMWHLEFTPTHMSTAPTTTMPNHSSWLVWSILSTTSPTNVNLLYNIAKRDMYWEHFFSIIALGTYGWNHHAQPEFWLLFLTSTNIFPIQLPYQRMQSLRP